MSCVTSSPSPASSASPPDSHRFRGILDYVGVWPRWWPSSALTRSPGSRKQQRTLLKTKKWYTYRQGRKPGSTPGSPPGCQPPACSAGRTSPCTTCGCGDAKALVDVSLSVIVLLSWRVFSCIAGGSVGQEKAVAMLKRKGGWCVCVVIVI